MPRKPGFQSLARVLSCLIALLAVFAMQASLAQLPGMAQRSQAESSAAAEQNPDSTKSSQTADKDLAALIRVLRDDKARQALIVQLEAASKAAGTKPSTAETNSSRTITEVLATETRHIAEGAANLADDARDLGASVAKQIEGASDIDLDDLKALSIAAALVVFGTIAIYLLLRVFVDRLQRNLATRAENSGILRRIKLIGFALLADLIALLLAWTTGYVIALFVGDSRQIAVGQSLFLNAFLMVQALRIIARCVFSPSRKSLRPLPFADAPATYWHKWLGRMISFVGYAFLFVAPVLAVNVSRASAGAVRILVLCVALVILVVIILRKRKSVREKMAGYAGKSRSRPFAFLISAIARGWHVLAILYLLTIFVLWVSDGNGALTEVLVKTAQCLVAIAIGAIVNTGILRLMTRGIQLAPETRVRFPDLQARLNNFVPKALGVVRLIVGAIVIMALLQILGVANVTAWWASAMGQRALGSLTSVALVLLGGAAAYLIVHSWIEYRIGQSMGKMAKARERTLLALFRNAFSIVLFLLVFMLVLSDLGVDIAPLLAGAGVIGLAVGFGSQKLVQDVINGAFIQLENTMNEGDVVTAGGITGSVERLTIRSVSLRTLDGTYHVIPFSSVDTVSNLTKTFSCHVAEIRVAYRESVSDAKAAMQEAFERLKQLPVAEGIIGDLEMHGVTGLSESAVLVRARIKTLPAAQWAIGRAYNELVKEVFDEHGIEIPARYMTLYMGDGKSGHASALPTDGGETPAPQLPSAT